MELIERWAKLLRDVGIILGIPTVILISTNLYTAQVDALKEQNNLLEKTQYDKALALIEAQHKLIEHERRVSAESISLINEAMKEIEGVTYNQVAPDDFDPDYFERSIQDVAQKLREIEIILSAKGAGG